MTVSENTKLVNDVLGRTDLIDADVVCIADDWRAFCNDPEKYRNTVVVDMVIVAPPSNERLMAFPSYTKAERDQ